MCSTTSKGIGLPSPQLCKHWWRKGECAYGDRCKFRHPPQETLPPWPKKKLWHGHKARTSGRSRSFRRWLDETFELTAKAHAGADVLVLDVAGGKGQLSWELVNVTGIAACVIDPRPALEVKRSVSMWKRGLWHKPVSIGFACARVQPPARLPTDEPRMPTHLRLFFQAGIWAATDTSIAANLARSRSAEWGVKGLHDEKEGIAASSSRAAATESVGRELERERGSGGRASRHDEKEGIAASSSRAAAAESVGRHGIRNASAADDAASSGVSDQVARVRRQLGAATLAVGLHPDQAAGAIIQFALSRGLPFAVVPCCVFRNEFTERRLGDGTRVTNYETLCDWLQALGVGIKRTVIPGLEGRNICLYRLAPERSKQGDSDNVKMRAVVV